MKLTLRALVIIAVSSQLLFNACSKNSTPVPVGSKSNSSVLVYVRPIGQAVFGMFESAIDGSSEKPIVGGFATVADPFFSADGKSLVFTAAKNTKDNGEIYISSFDGTNVNALTTNSPLGDEFPKLCPDGSTVVFDRNSSDSLTSEIFTVKHDGSGLNQVTNIKGLSYNPTWTPDQKTIIFSSDNHSTMNGSINLYSIHPDGSNLQQITNFTDDNTHYYQAEAPTISLDGSKIVFVLTDNYSGSSTLYSVPTAGGTPVLLSKLLNGQSNYPQFNFDGSQIYFAYSQTSTGASHIYHINVDGTNLVQITQGVIEAEPTIYIQH